MNTYEGVHKLAMKLKEANKVKKPLLRKLTEEQEAQIEELGHS